MTKRNKIIYWGATILLALGMFTGGIYWVTTALLASGKFSGQLLRVEENIDKITFLGYQVYFMSILGTWKILGIITILIPKFKLLKEWAYAGFFFVLTGAIISHIAKGDSFLEFISPLFFVLLTVISWYFRPADRKIILDKI